MTIALAGGRIMKLSCLKLPLQMTILVTVLRPANTDVAAFSQRDLQAKIEYCKTCHGLYGQGFRGSVPMPRIAGQQTEYLENQLRAFLERRRESQFMFNVANALSPAMPAALAAHFADLNPKPLGGAPKELEAAGKKLYEEGIPGAEIKPCATCHGPDAKGKGESPGLAGQLYDYTLKTMVNWSKERGLDRTKPDKSIIMESIVQNLTEAQISALAAYLSGLE
jgi:cytochrome c553